MMRAMPASRTIAQTHQTETCHALTALANEKRDLNASERAIH